MDTTATLADLIEGVQLEIGHSTASTVGINYRDTIAAAIRREYRRLHADFDWPNLLSWRTQSIAASAQTATFPTGVELANVVEIWAKNGTGPWRKLDRSLEVSDYNEVDSDAGAKRDPILKWKQNATGIEVWPVPLTAGSLRFVVKSKRVVLEAESDVCDLDADLIILFASANLLFKAGRDNAGSVLQRGRNTYETLRQRLQTGSVRVNLVGNG